MMKLHRHFLIALFVLALASLTFAQSAPLRVKLDDLAFLCGHNRGEMDGGIIDEHWSEVGGDSLIGMFRFIKEGKVQRYEFLAIEEAPEGTVLRIRRFSPGLTPWEPDHDQTHTLPLISFKPGEAVFQRADKATRITFRSTSNSTLEVTVERAGKKADVFAYAHNAE
ncbi:MAG: DUF6265 family protein [Terriglobales bacterium]